MRIQLTAEKYWPVILRLQNICSCIVSSSYMGLRIMPSFNFQKRFGPALEQGLKRSTIRRRPATQIAELNGYLIKWETADHV